MDLRSLCGLITALALCSCSKYEPPPEWPMVAHYTDGSFIASVGDDVLERGAICYPLTSVDHVIHGVLCHPPPNEWQKFPHCEGKNNVAYCQ